MKNKTKLFFFLLIIFSFAYQTKGQSIVDAFKTEAVKEMHVGRYGEAIDLLNKYISARPQQAEGYNLRGLCYEKREQYELAVYDFRSARKIAPNNKEINENLARTTKSWYSLLYNKIEGHKREIAINPNKPINYLEIGKSYKNLGEWGEAEQWYDEYLKREEASADEIIRYSEILAKNGHIKKGEPILKRYTEKYPNDQRLWSKYGYFTMWLGKKKIAIQAFENALLIKPYFKEARDGLDLARGKGYIYTVNDTSARYRYNYGIPPVRPVFEYPIDKYYRLLKKNPSNTGMRFKLANELLKANRVGEAYTQLQILHNDSLATPEFLALWDSVSAQREKEFREKITRYKAIIDSNAYDREATLKLGEYYTALENYDEAIPLYERYLSMVPDDYEIRYRYAKVATWNREFQKALEQMDILLSVDPNNIDYQLFDAQISVWLGQNLDKAQEYLNNVISKTPNNVEALIALGSLNLQKNDLIASQNYIDQARGIAPENPNINKLQSDLDFQKLRAEQEKLFEILEEGRKYALDGNCDAALPLYDEYLEKAEPNRLITKEYADVNACAHNYDKAIGIYNDLLNEQYDYDIELQRAKVYYYMGDSVNALSEFKKLAEIEPENFTVNLYLGDSYTKMHQYSQARDIYDEMLERNPDSTQITMVEQRIGWLPVTGLKGLFKSFPSYVLLTPYGLFYGDNMSFRLNTQGLRIDVGVMQFLSVGVEGYRTNLASSKTKVNLNTLKWNFLFTLEDNLSLTVGFGNYTFDNYYQKATGDAYLKYEIPDKFGAKLSFVKQDAAQVLFSPYLVDKRLDIKIGRFDGFFRINSGFMGSGSYSYMSVSDGNLGTNLQLRLGKYFYKDMAVGYELFNTVFKRKTSLYFSPPEYTSHSLFAEWDIIKNSTAKVNLGGKVGLVNNSSYILREIHAEATVKIFEKLTIQGRIAAGSSVQVQYGYNSLAFNLAVFWAL